MASVPETALKEAKAPAKHEGGSQTALDYIDEQLALEADAKEILPYKFDKCTYPLGPLRQNLFACLTCNPAPASPAQVWNPAGICYACSISCHGDHTLVELFCRRNFVCDCGTTRMPTTSPCNLRVDPISGRKGASSQEAAESNTYNHNFQNHFCGCEQEYDAETEKGTMYQCIGLGTVESGGCGEDWWHPHCLMGLPADWIERQKNKKEMGDTNGTEVVENDDISAPAGFPPDDDFDNLICYKCVESNPWIKPYAGYEQFLPPLMKGDLQPTPIEQPQQSQSAPSLKRRASEDSDNPVKRLKEDTDAATSEPTATETSFNTAAAEPKHKHDELGPVPEGQFSILMKADFREDLCHCPECFPNLIPHPQLREDEDEYQPSISDSERSLVDGGSGARSQGTGSILERGEAALSTMDRVKAIEGVMVYNHLRDKVKAFLKPYADSGQAVAAEDIKAYFEKLRGDEAAIKEAGTRPTVDLDDDDNNNGGDKRHEQRGY